MCGPRFTADWNGGECFAAFRCTERFEWSSDASWVVQSDLWLRSERPQWFLKVCNNRQALHSGVNNIGVDVNGRSWSTGGSSSACYCRTFRLPCHNCSLTTWRVNVWHFCEANHSTILHEISYVVKVFRAGCW